jgi:hypothetical protein
MDGYIAVFLVGVVVGFVVSLWLTGGGGERHYHY